MLKAEGKINDAVIEKRISRYSRYAFVETRQNGGEQDGSIRAQRP
jgi:hypothetical protein